ncbi:hypothetical protein G6F62_006897 [Rhizopus arrhizus]|nr:hypothetical protein G6F62_006897 [Rhizopus arrhizus]
MPTSITSKVVHRLSPLIDKDYITNLPYEIKLSILYYLDIKTIVHLSYVSSKWNKIIQDQQLWKDLYIQSGWSFNEEAIESYLVQRIIPKSISNTFIPHLVPRLKPFKVLSTNPLQQQTRYKDLISPEHIFSSSRSQPLKRGSLSNIFMNRPRRKTRFDETPIYHYKDATDTRYINWKRLYRNRLTIEKRWREGRYKVQEFCSNPHNGGIYCLQFNTSYLVTGSRDQQIKMWDIHTGLLIRTFEGHIGSVLCLQFDDRYLISGGSDAVLIVWDMRTGGKVNVLRGHQESVFNVKFKDNVLVSCSKDRTVRIWHLDSDGNAETHLILRGHRAAVNAVQFKDDRLVSASGDKTIKIWDMNTGECLRTLDSHSRGIACVEYDGKYIISGSCDQTIKIWDALTGECVQTLTSHSDLVRAIQLDSQSRTIVSGSYDGSLKIWALENGVLLKSLNGVNLGRILNLQFDFGRIICCSNLGKIIMYDFTYGIDTQFFN